MISLAMITGLAIVTAQTRSNPADEVLVARTKKALDATGLSYTPTPSGKNYQLLFDHPDKRKQSVYLAVNPFKPLGMVTVNLYTTVWVGKTEPDPAVVQKMVSSVKKFGTFYLFKGTNDVWAIRFQSKFDATDLPDSPKADDKLVNALKQMIYLVNAVGEEADKELNGAIDNGSSFGFEEQDLALNRTLLR